MAAFYSEKVMDHFANPRNVGELEDANGVGEIGNAKCGDIMKMYIKVEDGRIADVKFKTFGCGSAIATSSIATEMIKGKTIEEALQLSNKAVVEALDGLPAHKIHCSVLAEQSIKAAIADYYRRQGIADALLEALCARAAALDLAFLTLEVRASNAPAIALYRKHGFQTVGQRRNYYQKPDEDALLMTWFRREAETI